jgi:hypothetical protein
MAMLVPACSQDRPEPQVAASPAPLAEPVRPVRPVRAASNEDRVAAPPRELVSSWRLSPLYTQYADAGGLPVLASPRVSRYALLEAAFLIRRMVGERPEILRAMADSRVRFVVMSTGEMTTDVPEHSDLVPKSYWDRRARGLGATLARPAVSCGEENLLDLPGDPYWQENILVHEFAHAVHERGMNVVDPSFDERLRIAYQHALSSGLWAGTYAMTNRQEYWAEAAQSWFDCNRVNDDVHGPIDTRDKLRPYDPAIAALLTEVFGDRPWRYTKPSRRPPAERAHLAGFDPATAGSFVWPARASIDATALAVLPWMPASPSAAPPPPSTAGGNVATVRFENRRAREVSLDWLDFGGQRKHYASIGPGATVVQSTYVGHVWIVSERGTTLGAVVAAEGDNRAVIP